MNHRPRTSPPGAKPQPPNAVRVSEALAVLLATLRGRESACEIFNGEIGGKPFVVAVVIGAPVADVTKLIEELFDGLMVEYAEHEQTVEMPESL